VCSNKHDRKSQQNHAIWQKLSKFETPYVTQPCMYAPALHVFKYIDTIFILHAWRMHMGRPGLFLFDTEKIRTLIRDMSR
jgi:hypothetical protein